MAVNYTDFDKIWASASPLTPYEFSENNYKAGWNFVGATPPSRQMWDAFMKNADEKLQYLYNHESVPVGHEYFTFNPNVPQGSLPLFGGEYSRETYSTLWAWVQQQTGYLKTEAEWQQIYTTNAGNVPYYSDGDGSTTFRVPSLKCWVKGANGTVSEVGSYLAAGLPNITGNMTPSFLRSNSTPIITGAFIGTTAGTAASWGSSSSSSFNNITLDASKSNSIYGNSTTVQPPSIVGMWLVKAYGVVEETGQIDEQQYLDDRMADLKNVYLPANYLPLSGGIMTGNISNNANDLFAIGKDPSVLNQGIKIYGGNSFNSGASLYVYGKDNSSYGGMFRLFAHDGTSSKELRGNPNGELTWNENDITPQTATDINTETEVSVANNTIQNLLNFQLTKGTWLVQIVGIFYANATGYREMFIGNSASSGTIDRFKTTTSNAVSGTVTRLSLTTAISVASTTTYYLNVKQTSGGALNVGGGVRMFRLSSIS